jgi:RNA polymerase sigma-70 factor, ECF subfamily
MPTAPSPVTGRARPGSLSQLMTDADLVARVLAGDTEIYAALVARYRDRYTRFAGRMLGNDHDAEEALQDAFVRAYRSLGRCSDPARFGSWLLAILVNRCRTTARRRARRDRFAAALAPVLGRSEHPADRQAWRDEIDRALAGLDPMSREAFLLKHVEDLEYEEMARLTGVGVSALKMRVKRACQRLRVALEGAV